MHNNLIYTKYSQTTNFKRNFTCTVATISTTLLTLMKSTNPTANRSVYTYLVIEHVSHAGRLVPVAVQLELQLHAALLPVDVGAVQGRRVRGSARRQAGAARVGAAAPGRTRGAGHIAETRERVRQTAAGAGVRLVLHHGPDMSPGTRGLKPVTGECGWRRARRPNTLRVQVSSDNPDIECCWALR